MRLRIGSRDMTELLRQVISEVIWREEENNAAGFLEGE